MVEKKPRFIKVPVIVFILVLIVLAVGWYYLRTWPLRFHRELDEFFGDENWQSVSEETSSSIMFRRWNSTLGRKKAGWFHEWNIAFENQDGETEVWTITDHTLKINHKQHWIPFDPERYTVKQAFGQELLWISLDMVGEEVRTEVLDAVLPQKELDCLDVRISFRDGRPDGSLYEQILKEPWFRVQTMDASHFLQSDLYDFYVDVFAYDYRVEDLSEEEQNHLYSSLGAVEDALRNAYGADADYEILLGDGYQASSAESGT